MSTLVVDCTILGGKCQGFILGYDDAAGEPGLSHQTFFTSGSGEEKIWYQMSSFLSDRIAAPVTITALKVMKVLDAKALILVVRAQCQLHPKLSYGPHLRY